MLSHRHNGFIHQDKTSAYGALVFEYEIIPGTLNNMEKNFQLQICKDRCLLCIRAPWFLRT
jgi:hypothetical protein